MTCNTWFTGIKQLIFTMCLSLVLLCLLQGGDLAVHYKLSGLSDESIPSTKSVMDDYSIISSFQISTVQSNTENIVEIDIPFEIYFSKSQDFTREERYKKQQQRKIVVWSWKGGSSIQQDQFAQTVRAVIERLPMVPNDENIVKLVMETCATESNLGTMVTQINGNSSFGIYQIQYSTMEDLRKWLRLEHKDVYTAVNKFWDSKKSNEWNCNNNVPWQTAMCVTYYWKRFGTTLSDLCITVGSRAATHKIGYNSIHGKSSIVKYLADAETYL